MYLKKLETLYSLYSKDNSKQKWFVNLGVKLVGEMSDLCFNGPVYPKK